MEDFHLREHIERYLAGSSTRDLQDFDRNSMAFELIDFNKTDGFATRVIGNYDCVQRAVAMEG